MREQQSLLQAGQMKPDGVVGTVEALSLRRSRFSDAFRPLLMSACLVPCFTFCSSRGGRLQLSPSM